MGCYICAKEKQPKQKIFTVVPSRLVRENNKSVSDLYFFESFIGQGVLGKVYSCSHRVTNLKRCVKVVPKKAIKETKTRFKFINEISQIKEMDQENLIRMMEFFEDEKNYFLVTELATGGELLDYMIKSREVGEDQVRFYMKQIFQALNFIHSKKLVHKDVKLENILLLTSDSVHIKLVNTGTTVISGQSRQLKSPHPNFCFTAPEVHRNKYDSKSDIYSAGVLMFFLLTGKAPFPGSSTDSILSNQKSRTLINCQISSEAQALIYLLLDPNPEVRPTTSKILSHPWFTSYTPTEKPPINEIIENLQEYRAQVHLRKQIISFVLSQVIYESNETELKLALKKSDNQKTGFIKVDELLKTCKSVWDDKKVDDIVADYFDTLNLDEEGRVEIKFFIEEVGRQEKKVRIERLENGFSGFEKFLGAKVFANEISEVLEDYDIENSAWNSILAQIESVGGSMDVLELKNLMISTLA